MPKILIIVESPGKTTKIQAYAGKDYTVKASVGHIIDLPFKRLGVDVDKDFEPEYVDIERQKKNIDDLKKAIKASDQVILAADLDREGEMIAWSLAHRFKLSKPQRITFDAITKDKIQEALKSPRSINYDLVDAQKARRILDRLIGYKLSPLVQKHVNYLARSAGRVQSVVVKLIIEKENDIKDFFKKEESSFYKVKGSFMHNDIQFDTSVHTKGKIVDGMYNGAQLKLESKTEMKKIMENFSKSTFNVFSKLTKEVTQNPSPPFTTSTLLQEGTSKLGMSSTTVKQSSQKLYNKSFITYIRTDTTALSSEAMEKLKLHVNDKYGNEYYKSRNSSSKGKTQEAHEAIRPTNFSLEFLPDNNDLTDTDKRLYNLIWRRTIASQMSAAKYARHVFQIESDKEKHHIFEFSYDQLEFPGFLKVYNTDYQKKMTKIDLPDKKDIMSPLEIIAKQEYLRPPPRYTESSLINKLDPKNLNIGRPSTYNSIISKILEREYVEMPELIEGISKNSNKMVLSFKKNNKVNNVGAIEEMDEEIKLGEEKKKFMPTELGIMTNDYLVEHFNKILDYKFTSDMEDSLDDIAAGEKNWRKVLSKFWVDFKPMLDLQANAKPSVDKYTKSLGKHPNGLEIIARMGRYGPMLEMCKSKSSCLTAPIKKPFTLESITLEGAIKIFEWPKPLGKIGKADASLYKGKYGLYVKFGKDKIGIPKEKSESDVTLEYIQELINERGKRNLGSFEDEIKSYIILNGPYGKYIKVVDKKSKAKKPKTLNVKLPEDAVIETLNVEKIKEIIDNHFKNRFKGKKPFTKESTVSQKGGNKQFTKNTSTKNTNIKRITKKPIKK